MHRNGLWLIFLSLFLVISGWFTFKAGRQVVGYLRCSEMIPAQIGQWGMEREGGAKFFLTAQYTYRFNGIEYAGRGRLSDRIYRNPWAAEVAIPGLEARSWSVWIDPSLPDQSLLVRNFPFKEISYALLLIGLFLYCSWIGYKVGAGSPSQTDPHL